MDKPLQPRETGKTRAMTRRTDPFVGFRQEMDTLFDRFFGSQRFMSWPRSALVDWNFPAAEDGEWLYPEMDVVENDKEFLISAELPGMSEDDIELAVADGMLTLKGEKRMEKTEGKGKKERLIERRFGHFERSFTLPPTVDFQHVDATFKKGVLWIKLPRLAAEVAKAKKVKIH